MRRNNVMTAVVPPIEPVRKRTTSRAKQELPAISPSPNTATLTLEFAPAPSIDQSVSAKPQSSKRVSAAVKAAPHLMLAVMRETIAPEAPAPVAAKTPRAKAIAASPVEVPVAPKAKAEKAEFQTANVTEVSAEVEKPKTQTAIAEPAPIKVAKSKAVPVSTMSEPILQTVAAEPALPKRTRAKTVAASITTIPAPVASVKATEVKAKPAQPIVQTAASEPITTKTARVKSVAAVPKTALIAPVKPIVQATVALPVLPSKSEKAESKASVRKSKVQTNIIAPPPATPVKAQTMAPKTAARNAANVPDVIAQKNTTPKPKPSIPEKVAPKTIQVTADTPKAAQNSKQAVRVLTSAAAKTVKAKPIVPKEPPVRIAPEFEYASGRLWRMSGRHAVALVKDAALAGELLATEPKNLTRDAMAVYYDRKGKAFAWQVRFDTDRWNDIVRRLE